MFFLVKLKFYGIKFNIVNYSVCLFLNIVVIARLGSQKSISSICCQYSKRHVLILVATDHT